MIPGLANDMAAGRRPLPRGPTAHWQTGAQSDYTQNVHLYAHTSAKP